MNLEAHGEPCSAPFLRSSGPELPGLRSGRGHGQPWLRVAGGGGALSPTGRVRQDACDRTCASGRAVFPRPALRSRVGPQEPRTRGRGRGRGSGPNAAPETRARGPGAARHGCSVAAARVPGVSSGPPLSRRTARFAFSSAARCPLLAAVSVILPPLVPLSPRAPCLQQPHGHLLPSCCHAFGSWENLTH